MKAARMQWALNRLRCMTPAEIAYRIRQAAIKALEKRLRTGHVPGIVTAAPRTPGMPGAPALLPAEAEALLADADRICAGQLTLFAGKRFDVGALPEWNRDPATGIAAPTMFAGDIDVTRRELVGDIKHLWELNRHLQLVRLAQAALIAQVDQQPGYLRTLAAQLRGWLDQCPPNTGPNWTSSLEMGIRLINWSLLWQLVGGDAGALFAGAEGRRLRTDWLHSVHAHCAGIARHLSRHSSANNHLIGELAGLYLASATWPCWDASDRWRARAVRELEAQAQLQFSPDGVNREQAFAYQIFSAEFLFLAGLAGQAWDQPFSPAYWESLRRGLRFLRSVRDVGGRMPMVGDADDGIVFRLGPGAEDRAQQLLALGDAVFNEGQGGQEGQAGSAGVRWLLHMFPGARPQLPGAQSGAGFEWAFPDGGYLLFGADFGQPREIKGMLDCGPLGYLGIAAHGHADALAMTLSVAGEQCLVDPGTYSYWREREWRDYFRGTSAHNTVRVDGQDQSVSGGRFMWLRKAACRIERMPVAPDNFDFCGSHDGYLRLPDPVRHRRSVCFEAAQHSQTYTLVVRDELAARLPHRMELFWHFAPELEVTLGSEGLRVRGRAFEMRMQVSADEHSQELVRGSENPLLGWYSPSYEMKQACDVLKITTLSGAVPVECRITIMFI
jgi:hypothetical protein